MKTIPCWCLTTFSICDTGNLIGYKYGRWRCYPEIKIVNKLTKDKHVYVVTELHGLLLKLSTLNRQHYLPVS